MNRFMHPLSYGAEIQGDQVRFRLWAPGAREVGLELEGGVPRAMERREGGFVELTVAAGAGNRYRFVIDGALAVPDPAARFQPEGVHGASEVIDPRAYLWRTPDFRARPWAEMVFYELHLGTFTPDGSYAGAIEKLDLLVDLGVTAVELMPLAATPGGHNWGYDGVLPFAPNAAYGRPNDLKRLIDEAHARGLAMFLDVVYNHFGPEGNYLHRYAPAFFTAAHETPWGSAIDVDGAEREAVRGFFIENALYWLEEYRFDGLRLDAIHAIPSTRSPSFVEELATVVRSRIRDRPVHLVLENDDNRASLLERDEGAPRQYDAQWNDDFHHAIHVLVTGETDGYYRDYSSPLAALGRCLSEGFAYQGEPSGHRGGAHRGEPSGHLPATAFVTFIQNHDQVGNRAFGERLHEIVASPEALDAAITIALLAPSIPLLFMGEEWAASTPFQFFCDFENGLREAVRAGRKAELGSFSAFSSEGELPDPCGVDTMQRSRLRWEERALPEHQRMLGRYRELLAIRRREIVPRLSEPFQGRYETYAARLLVRFSGQGWQIGLDLNAGESPITRERLAGERIVASTANLEAPHRLPPWGVVWWAVDC